MANKYTENERVYRGVLLMFDKPQIAKIIRDYRLGKIDRIDTLGIRQAEIDDVLRARTWALSGLSAAQREKERQENELPK